MKNLTLLFATLCVAATAATAQPFPSETIYPHNTKIYHKGWTDLNKNGRKDPYEDPSLPIDERIDDLMAQMTIEEKSCQLATFYGYRKVMTDTLPTAEWKSSILKDGIANIDEHCNRETGDPVLLAKMIREVQRFFVEQTRLGIPVDFTNEGIRGLCAPLATSFPSMNGLGTTWDRDLAYRQGVTEAKEARVMGYTNIYAPILDVTRDQRWGRWDGSIAEDPYLVAELGVAMAKGIQSQRVVSTPKHFVGYGDCKGARQWDARTDPHITPSEMYYIHEYPFRKVFGQAGALGVMCAYNDYDGVPMAASHHFLTEVLRGEMGFRGYVVSDSFAIGRLAAIHHVCADQKQACLMALMAGLNVRTEFNDPTQYVGYIRQLAAEGRLPIEQIDRLVRDVLYVKFWIGLFDNPYSGDPDKVAQTLASTESKELAQRASDECVVLLKNADNILPLGNRYHRIAVIGPNADDSNYVSTHYGPTSFAAKSTVLSGLREVYAGCDVETTYAKGIDIKNSGWPENELIADTLTERERQMIDEAVGVVNASDVAVVVVGDDVTTSGESRTRTELNLAGHQQQLVEAVVATGKPVVLVLVWGRPATINYADRYCKAIVAAGFPGAQGGVSIARVLKGDYNPGGKLNGTWPRSTGQLPMNVPTKPNANWEQMSSYTVGNKGLLYCFGYGLSYTTFQYSDLQFDRTTTDDGFVEVSCTITNTGDREGDEVVQLYINDVISSTTTYEKNLRGFERVHLAAGESKRVQFSIVPDDLVLIDAQKRRVVESGEFKVMVASSYDDVRLSGSFYVGRTTEPTTGAADKSDKMMIDVQ